jgi:hypothetical protein
MELDSGAHYVRIACNEISSSFLDKRLSPDFKLIKLLTVSTTPCWGCQLTNKECAKRRKTPDKKYKRNKLN